LLGPQNLTTGLLVEMLEAQQEGHKKQGSMLVSENVQRAIPELENTIDSCLQKQLAWFNRHHNWFHPMVSHQNHSRQNQH